jgi:hypothetical protein
MTAGFAVTAVVGIPPLPRRCGFDLTHWPPLNYVERENGR